MASVIKKALSGLVHTALGPFIEHSKVLSIKYWQPDTMLEVVLYTPGLNFAAWNTIQRFKVEVGELEFRSYTPADWNAEKKTCTIYIETAHDGPGSRWAKNLKQGDTVVFGAGGVANLPGNSGKVLCLGDGSALGHFTCLQKLLDPTRNPLTAVVFFADQYTLPQSLSQNTSFKFIMDRSGNSSDALTAFVNSNKLDDYTSVYINGEGGMIRSLRNLLRNRPEVNAKISVGTFW